VLDSLIQNGVAVTISEYQCQWDQPTRYCKQHSERNADISTSTKTAVDINGGSVLVGDSLLYTIKVRNTGTAATSLVTGDDTIPSRVKVKTSSISGVVHKWEYNHLGNSGNAGGG